LRILFVTVTSKRGRRGRFSSLGVGHLVAVLHQIPGIQVESVTTSSPKILIECLDRFRPNVVGFSSVSEFWGVTIELSKIANCRGLTVIVGGHNLSHLPECLHPSMHIGVIGEGEETIRELFTGGIGKQWKFLDDLDDIAGIVFWRNGQIIQTPGRKSIVDLGSLPHPVRQTGDVHILTSRGCPFNCSFCASRAFWCSYRLFPADWVMDELGLILEKTPNTKWIYIWDDQFIANQKRLELLKMKMAAVGFDNRFMLAIQCRAETITPEIIPILKALNVRAVGIGMESGHDRILRLLKVGKANVAANDHAIELLRSAGINLYASFILGHPEETEQEAEATYDYIKSRKIKFFDVNLLTPFPGTVYWQTALDNGLIDIDDTAVWRRLNSNNLTNPILPIPDYIKHLYRKLRWLKVWRRLVNYKRHPTQERIIKND